MVDAGRLTFETALGTMALGWSPRGLTFVWLLSADRAPGPKEHLALPEVAIADAPAWVADVAARLTRHVAGRPERYDDVPLDDEALSPLRRRAHAIARTVGPGETITYGAMAERAGQPGAARAMGRAMATNPFIIVVPCHRVLAAHGGAGGFSAPGGLDTKARLLAIEGVALARPAASAQLDLFGGE